MAWREVEHPQESTGGRGRPKKKNTMESRRNRRALKEIGNLPTIEGIEANPSRRMTRSYYAQLLAKAQATAAADMFELRQAERSSFDYGEVVNPDALVDVIDIDSSEDEKSRSFKSSVSSGGVDHSAAKLDVIDIYSSEDEHSRRIKSSSASRHSAVKFDVIELESSEDEQSPEENTADYVYVSEPNPFSPIEISMSKEETDELKGSPRSCFSWRSITVFLLIGLAVALFSVLAVHAPLTDVFMLKDKLKASFQKSSLHQTQGLDMRNPQCACSSGSSTFENNPIKNVDGFLLKKVLNGSFHNTSLYQTGGLNGIYETESQEKSGLGRTIRKIPLLHSTPQWDYSYGSGSFTIIQKNSIKNENGDDVSVIPQWARRLYGSLTTYEYPIKNGHGDDEFVAPQWTHRLPGSFTIYENYPIENTHGDAEELFTPQHLLLALREFYNTIEIFYQELTGGEFASTIKCQVAAPSRP